ncbi:hypothetical protein ABES80_13340 [Bacillus gobiensis]|uniref:hypothetical protein n=1 Tax=Bacillus gobiensis TaxID=1441095 RepID=UPI003D1E61ED
MRKGKVVIITGASSGIGEAAAKVLAKRFLMACGKKKLRITFALRFFHLEQWKQSCFILLRMKKYYTV